VRPWRLAAALLLLAAPAEAHVVLQRATLRQLLQTAERAAVVRFESPLRIWSAPDGSDRQDYFSVRVLEPLPVPGEPAPDTSARLDVFPHAEGMPDWQQGDVALLFLQRTDAHPELAALAPRFPWFTLQEPGQEWRLEGEAGAAVHAAALAWLELEATPREEAPARLRALLLDGLRSPSPELRADAFAELVRALPSDALFPDAEAVAPFARAGRPGGGLPFPLRLAVLRLLDGRHGFDGRAALRAVTAETLPPEARLQLVQVAGAAHDPGLGVWLAGQLQAAPDPRVRRAAAYALGRPEHDAAVPALLGAAWGADPAVARAAVSALAGIGSSGARAALARLAEAGAEGPGGGAPGSPHAAVARLARAALRRPAAPPR